MHASINVARVSSWLNIEHPVGTTEYICKIVYTLQSTCIKICCSPCPKSVYSGTSVSRSQSAYWPWAQSVCVSGINTQLCSQHWLKYFVQFYGKSTYTSRVPARGLARRSFSTSPLVIRWCRMLNSFYLFLMFWSKKSASCSVQIGEAFV